MKRVMVMIACLSMLVLSVSCVAHRTCSSEEMVKMKEGGFSMEDINRTCVSYKLSDEVVQATGQLLQSELARQFPKRGQPVAVASTCTTQLGQCPLMQPGASGEPCSCPSWYGQIPGVMR